MPRPMSTLAGPRFIPICMSLHPWLPPSRCVGGLDQGRRLRSGSASRKGSIEETQVARERKIEDSAQKRIEDDELDGY